MGGISLRRGVFVGLVLSIVWGAAVVLLAASGIGILAPVQAEVPFPVVQPGNLPVSMVLEGAFASPPPPQVRNGPWMVQLAYGFRLAASGAPSIMVWEIGRATPPTMTAPPSAPSLPGGGRLSQGIAGNGAPYTQLQFNYGPREFVVTGFHIPAAAVTRVAESVLARAEALAGGSARGPGA